VVEEQLAADVAVAVDVDVASWRLRMRRTKVNFMKAFWPQSSDTILTA
jgi:hypothetical protein